MGVPSSSPVCDRQSELLFFYEIPTNQHTTFITPPDYVTVVVARDGVGDLVNKNSRLNGDLARSRFQDLGPRWWFRFPARYSRYLVVVLARDRKSNQFAYLLTDVDSV